MSSENRASVIAKLSKVAKKHYTPVKPVTGRTVLENLLYACLLEEGDFTAADEAYARLEQYADWNEVRVSTTQELAEVAASLANAPAAVERLKLALHSVFETHYAYELEFLLKESQAKIVAQLEKYKGVSPFVIAYLVQNCFGGHKVPIADATLNLAETLGLINAKEREAGAIPGLERAISKSKGVEFFSTVHQLAIAFMKQPQDKGVRSQLKEISPEAVRRLEGEDAAASGGDSKKSAGGKKAAAAKESKPAGDPPKKSGKPDSQKSKSPSAASQSNNTEAAKPKAKSADKPAAKPAAKAAVKKSSAAAPAAPKKNKPAPPAAKKTADTGKSSTGRKKPR